MCKGVKLSDLLQLGNILSLRTKSAFFCEAKNDYIILSVRIDRREDRARIFYESYNANNKKIHAKRIIGIPIGVLIS